MIGIGLIGSRFAAELHAHALAPLRGVTCELVAVCSRTREHAEAFARRFAIPHVYTDHRALLERADIQLVTLPVVTSLHHVLAVDAANAGKHVIVEKPLTGCFVDAASLSRRAMLAETLRNADAVLDACQRNRVTLGYAENFVYAPPVAKLRRLIAQSGGTVLDLRAEESHSGSHAEYSRRWVTSGGGSLLRMGSHPIGAVIHLKHYEGQVKHGRPIRVRSVHADGDTVIVLWDGRGTANDGQPYQNSYAWFMALRDGKVVDGTAFYDSISFNELWARVQPRT